MDIFLYIGEKTVFDEFYFTLILYFYKVFMLIIVFNVLLGEQGEIINEKLKIIKADAILLFLILAQSTFEYAYNELPDTTVLGLDTAAIYGLMTSILFVPLMVFMALWGMQQYKKKRYIERNRF